MKNILLTFLSDGAKKEASYQVGDSGHIVKTRHSNESAVYELAQSTTIDLIFVFASQKVREVRRIDEKEQNTIDFFKERIKNIVSPDKVIECVYNEKNAMNSALSDISQMAEIILSHKKEFGDEEVVLHADMTGGWRNASMMMLGVMRLLQFSQMKLGKVLYSNWEPNREVNNVEDSIDVYRFFDLVAGAKEFVKYGSVAELKAYFAEEKDLSVELTQLLEAMENFSNSIKLCRYGDFSEAIADLNSKIEAFIKKTDSERNTNDKLFATMIPVIKESYQALFTATDDLGVIEWCTNNGYLQQALTLYTEHVPDYVFHNGLLEIAKDANKEKDGKTRFESAFEDYKKNLVSGDNSSFFALGVYKPYTFDNDINKAKKKLGSKLKDDAVLFFKKKLTACEYIERLKTAKQEVVEKWPVETDFDEERVRHLFAQAECLQQNSDLSVIGKDHMDLQKFVCEYFKDVGREVENRTSGQVIYKGFKYIMDTCNVEKLLELFALDIKTDDDKINSIVRGKSIEKLIKNKEYITHVKDIKLVVQIANDYHVLKRIRNSSNHAKKGTSVSIEIVEQKLREGIQRLREGYKSVQNET